VGHPQRRRQVSVVGTADIGSIGVGVGSSPRSARSDRGLLHWLVNAIPRWCQLATLGVTSTVMVREIVERVEWPRADIAVVVLVSEKRLTYVTAIGNS